MCGISGLVDIKGSGDVAQATVQAMNDTMIHRGPNGAGFHFEPGVGLGHRRLSIIDLEGGKQPLYNEDNSVVVTYNGEIYNYKELMTTLQAAGHVFRTHCDTEVIVHAWEEWGADCVNHFNGMFAFAIWDRNRETLFLARDRVGIKPLYYTLIDGHLLGFGSELKALAPLNHSRRVDPQAVEDYLTFGYVPEPKTIFDQVKKLAPGHTIEIKRGQTSFEQRQYWDVPLFEAPQETQTDPACVVNALQAAVQRRLVADVPLGAFLSGGIDSSAVVAMMHQNIGDEQLLTCSIGFDNEAYNESEYADLVADQLKTSHQQKIVSVNDFDLIDELVDVYDEPYADSSAIPTYRVCELARKHVTVALSGDGGDENFLGYRRYNLFKFEEMARSRIPHTVRKPLFGTLGKYYPKLDWAPRFVRGKSTFQALARDTVGSYLHTVSILDDDTRHLLYSKQMRDELQGYTSREVFDGHVHDKSFSDQMRLVQYLDFKTYLVGDILTKVDRASMRHSLEVRVPFLDHTFVEWVSSLSTEQKLRGTEGKHILKKSMEPHLPHDVLYRRKMGFAVPLEHWFRTTLKDEMLQLPNSEALLDLGLFEKSSLEKIVKLHASGRRDFSGPVWTLMMFRRFVEKNAA